MSQLHIVSIKGEGRGGKSNWDIVWKYAIFFFDGVPNNLWLTFLWLTVTHIIHTHTHAALYIKIKILMSPRKSLLWRTGRWSSLEGRLVWRLVCRGLGSMIPAWSSNPIVPSSLLLTSSSKSSLKDKKNIIRMDRGQINPSQLSLCPH